MYAGLGEVAASIILHHYVSVAEQELHGRIITRMEDGMLHPLTDDEIVTSLHIVAKAMGFTNEVLLP